MASSQAMRCESAGKVAQPRAADVRVGVGDVADAHVEHGPVPRRDGDAAAVGVGVVGGQPVLAVRAGVVRVAAPVRGLRPARPSRHFASQLPLRARVVAVDGVGEGGGEHGDVGRARAPGRHHVKGHVLLVRRPRQHQGVDAASACRRAPSIRSRSASRSRRCRRRGSGWRRTDRVRGESTSRCRPSEAPVTRAARRVHQASVKPAGPGVVRPGSTATSRGEIPGGDGAGDLAAVRRATSISASVRARSKSSRGFELAVEVCAWACRLSSAAMSSGPSAAGDAASSPRA